MATKAKTTGSTLATKDITQDNIPQMLEMVNAKISALKGDREKATRITGELGVFGKISDCHDTMKLRAAYGYITSKVTKISEYDGVFQQIAPTVKVPVYKESGATVEQWQEEIKAQYKEVVFKEELQKLETVKQKLTDNLSAQDKLKATLGDIADLLSVQE